MKVWGYVLAGNLSPGFAYSAKICCPDPWLHVRGHMNISGGNSINDQPILLEVTKLSSTSLEDKRIKFRLIRISHSVSNHQLKSEAFGENHRRTVKWLFCIHGDRCNIAGESRASSVSVYMLFMLIKSV